MALEAGDGFISGLVITNPVNAVDQVAQGDDHLRLIKTAIKGTFPNLNGAVTATPAQLNVLATDGAGAGMLADIAAIADPNADRLLGWDDSAGAVIAFGLSTGLTVNGPGTSIQIDTAVVPTLSANNIWTGTQIISSTGPTLRFTETDAAANNGIWYLSASSERFSLVATNDAINAFANVLIVDRTAQTIDEVELNATLFDFNGNLDLSGTVTSPNTSASEVGTKGVPRVSKTADYTLAAVDSGTELVCTSAADDITVQATGAPVAGMTVFIENGTGGSIDIIQGSGMTLTLDGTATTGSRTLAAGGRAYVRFTSSSAASVGGPGTA
jgi:hypothetical protein